jgi:hypothetical protein
MKIGYGKLGRSMPLTLADCGTVGGDIEGVAVLVEMARRWPQHEFYIVGRNSGENPKDVGLPSNVYNPWMQWKQDEKEWAKRTNFAGSYLEIEDQIKLREFYDADIAPFFATLDGLVMWEGQHGSSNSPLPFVDAPHILTKPQDSSIKYCGFFMAGINAFRDRDPMKYEEIILNADARNVRQSRDQRWPARHPVLAQFNTSKNVQHNRGRGHLLPTAQEAMVPDEWRKYATPNGHMWSSTVKYCYSRVEINALVPGTEYSSLITYDETWEGRNHFGLFINEARAYVNKKLARKNAMKAYVMPLKPAFVHGKWSDASQKELGVLIQPAPWEQYFPLLHSVRCTFTTPSSGSGWATTKPWEAFAAGTVCFFHPDYDSQGHILKDAPDELRNYLRVIGPTSLAKRVEEMNNDRDKWLHIVRMQRAHFDKAVAELRYMQMIEERLKITEPVGV